MRTLLLLLLLCATQTSFGQLEVRLVANSDFVVLPTSDHGRIRSGNLRSYALPPVSFAGGLELVNVGKKNGLPSFIGARRGFIAGSDLSVDFKGEADLCKDGIPAGITPVFAQVRLQGVNYWQFYGQVGVAKIPELRQMTFSVGGGLTVFTRQRLHQAVTQLDASGERGEAPTCGYGFAVGPNRELQVIPEGAEERIDLGQSLLQPTSAYGEVQVSFEAGEKLQLALSGQIGFTKLGNADLFTDGSRVQTLNSRLNNRTWKAIGIVARGQVFRARTRVQGKD